MVSPLLEKAVNDGTIAESVIDDKVMRILTPMIQIGVFDQVLPYGDRSNNVTTPEHFELARNLSAAATVMVKNDDQLLPLSPTSPLNIVVVGPAGSLSPIVAGTGSGAVSPAGSIVTALQGINEVTGAAGGVVSYVNATNFAADSSSQFSDEDANLIKQADVVVVVAAVEAGEGRDRETLNLGSGQDNMILAAAALNVNTMVVTCNPGAILMSAWIDQVKSALLMFMPVSVCCHIYSIFCVFSGTLIICSLLSLSL
jgi:beta-glucosidase